MGGRGLLHNLKEPDRARNANTWTRAKRERMSRSVRRVLYRRRRWRPSLSDPRYHGPQATYPQDGDGPSAACCSVLLRVGFSKPIRSPESLVGSYPTVSPLPRAQTLGGLFSVALSLGSPRVAVSHHPALWSPDVPREVSLTRPPDRLIRADHHSRAASMPICSSGCRPPNRKAPPHRVQHWISKR